MPNRMWISVLLVTLICISALYLYKDDKGPVYIILKAFSICMLIGTLIFVIAAIYDL